MRSAAATVLGLGFFGLLSFAGPSAQAEYYCSDGFVPSYGRCIAVAARDEVELFLNDAGTVYDGPVVRHVRRHRHGLRARY